MARRSSKKQKGKGSRRQAVGKIDRGLDGTIADALEMGLTSEGLVNGALATLDREQIPRTFKFLEALSKAVGTDPHVFFGLGRIAAELDDHDQALQCFRDAVELLPDFAEAHFHLGASALELGEVDVAIDALNEAVLSSEEDAPLREDATALLAKAEARAEEQDEPQSAG